MVVAVEESSFYGFRDGSITDSNLHTGKGIFDLSVIGKSHLECNTLSSSL